MKNLIVAFILLLSTTAALAGDNGSYLQCKSNSGRTKLLLGNIGGLKVDESGKAIDFVQLSIDSKTLGMLEEDNSVLKVQLDDSTVRYEEADLERTDLITIRQLSQTRYVILSGIDPRTNTSLTHTIQLTCKTVENPI